MTVGLDYASYSHHLPVYHDSHRLGLWAHAWVHANAHARTPGPYEDHNGGARFFCLQNTSVGCEETTKNVLLSSNDHRQKHFSF
jgi:hypothetical protein